MLAATASTASCPIAGIANTEKHLYGIQFHPEVYHSTDGKQLLENFLVSIAGLKQDWTPDSFIEETVAAIQAKVGNEKVVLGLSGGVDSTVAAVLLNKAIGENL